MQAASKTDEIRQYTPREAARILKINVGTLANWRAGKGSVHLPFVKYGKSVYYLHSDIVAYQQAHRYTTTAEAFSNESA